ncbi:MAG: acetyl-CoA carboxylase biotin carboxyl carrier protein subunit [Firmicutes bacterium]|nr:acetyl-CoA carboxylase biotin carboxyl carrier protein subunit [Bacillota bacterium]
MDKYRIRLDGEVYEIEVEKLGSEESAATTATATATKEVKKEAPKKPVEKKEPVKEAASSDGEEVVAPMPGSIFDIKVSEGENVKEGQVLVVLEAMKMENEIVAPKDGVVSSINTSKGAQVEVEEVLVTLD